MKKILVFCMIVCGCTGLFSQSAEKIAQMLEAPTVNFADISYVAATYLNLVENSTSGEDSINALDRYTEFPKISQNNDALTYEDFAYFCMRTWNIKGGLFYTLTKSPRYAFTELQAKNIIHPSIQPDDFVPGYAVLTYITDVIAYSEEHATLDLSKFVKMPMKFHTFMR